MASTTQAGFWAVAALSRYTSGLPWTVCLRTGKSARTRSTSKAAWISPICVLMKFLEQDPLERIPQCVHFNAIDDVLGESVGQQTARFAGADAAGPQVKQRLRVQLAD